MKEIFVYSRPAVEAIEPHTEPHLVISINCPGEPPAKIRSNRAQLGRVNLFFWDIDRLESLPDGRVRLHGSDTVFENIKEADLCQATDAKAIVDLVEAHPEARNIVIHCTAGKSRSAAVAAALHKVLNGSDAPIFDNKRYSPNMRVYRMVLEEWYERHPLVQVPEEDA
jgi:predicted protein tyrosine phosphatase